MNSNEKETVIAANSKTYKALSHLPDKHVYKNILYHIYVIKKIEKGLKQAQSGNVMSHDAAKRKMAYWLKD